MVACCARESETAREMRRMISKPRPISPFEVVDVVVVDGGGAMV